MKKDNCCSERSPEKLTVPFFGGHPVYVCVCVLGGGGYERKGEGVHPWAGFP